MITQLGMSKNFGMTALSTANSLYLGGDTTLACSDETAARIDAEVVETIRACHGKAFDLLKADQDKLHELSEALMVKETLTGEEFMQILEANPAQLPAGTEQPAAETAPDAEAAPDAAAAPGGESAEESGK